MPPKLPKEFYWVDLKLMDDFFRLDPVNEAFYETFMSLREEPFGVTLDAVKVFNEVYYTITRYRYENTYITGGFFYPSEIEADLGWKYDAVRVAFVPESLITMPLLEFALSGSILLPVVTAVSSISSTHGYTPEVDPP